MSGLVRILGGRRPSDKVERPRHIPELDGLRGTAALMVVIFHYIVQPLNLHPIAFLGGVPKYFMMLEAGVDVFFVLSGFLLGGILLDQRNSLNCLPVFYIRRAARILPPYAFVLGCYALASAWYNATAWPGLSWLMSDPLPFWSYVLYIQNFYMAATSSFGSSFLGVTWSLAIEEQFYLIVPLLIIVTPNKYIPYLVGALVFMALALRVVFFVAAPELQLANFVLLPTRCDSLFLGVAAAWIVRSPKIVAAIEKHPSKLSLSFWAAMAVCCALAVVGRGRTSWHTTYAYTWLAITVTIFMIYIRVRSGGVIGACLRLNWLRSFGRISYMVYLVHIPVLGLCFAVLQHREPTLLSGIDCLISGLAFLLTILVAEATWRTFEVRFIRLGHRFAYKKRNDATQAELLCSTPSGAEVESDGAGACPLT